MVERRAETVQEGDAAEPPAGSIRRHATTNPVRQFVQTARGPPVGTCRRLLRAVSLASVPTITAPPSPTVGWSAAALPAAAALVKDRSCAASARGRLRHGDDREPSEADTKRIAIGSRVRRDGNYGDLARFWAVAPEHAIGARGAVLGVGFEDLVMRIERVRERVVLVRVQAWVTGILTEQ